MPVRPTSGCRGERAASALRRITAIPRIEWHRWPYLAVLPGLIAIMAKAEAKSRGGLSIAYPIPVLLACNVEADCGQFGSILVADVIGCLPDESGALDRLTVSSRPSATLQIESQCREDLL